MRGRWYLHVAWVIAAVVACVFVTVVVVNAGTRRSPHPDAEEQEKVVTNSASSTGSCGVDKPTETTVFQVHATLSEYKLEADSDYHLVIVDGTSHMIAEIPDPACVGSTSPLLTSIQKGAGGIRC